MALRSIRNPHVLAAGPARARPAGARQARQCMQCKIRYVRDVLKEMQEGCQIKQPHETESMQGPCSSRDVV